MMNAVGICAFSQSHGADLGEDKLSNRGDGTMRKFFAAAVGSVVAFVGFAGAANASATIDLIWAATGTDLIGGIASPLIPSSNITLQVILTAGPAGSMGAGVSVDYSAVVPLLTVFGYANTPGIAALPIELMVVTDTGSRIENINSTSAPAPGWSLGIGLPAGASAQLGTITFHKSAAITGTVEIRSDANSLTDAVLDLSGGDLTATTTFNSAFYIPEPSALPALGSGIAILALLYRRRTRSL